MIVDTTSFRRTALLLLMVLSAARVSSASDATAMASLTDADTNTESHIGRTSFRGSQHNHHRQLAKDKSKEDDDKDDEGGMSIDRNGQPLSGATSTHSGTPFKGTTVGCFNYNNWIDRLGNNCNYYVTNFRQCNDPAIGVASSGTAVTPREACCICGGGMKTNEGTVVTPVPPATGGTGGGGTDSDPPATGGGMDPVPPATGGGMDPVPPTTGGGGAVITPVPPATETPPSTGSGGGTGVNTPCVAAGRLCTQAQDCPTCCSRCCSGKHYKLATGQDSFAQEYGAVCVVYVNGMEIDIRGGGGK